MRLIVKIWNNNKGLILFIFLMLFFRTAIADWYHVPSGSMKPNILIGDRVWVDKLAYDVKIPLTDINLNRHSEPQRGDVIVFNSAVSNERLIKRVIAIPGDTVSMQGNQLFINHQPLELKLDRMHQPASDNTEIDHLVILEELAQTMNHESPSRYSVQYSSNIDYRNSFGPIEVSSDHFWVMGDNRDNSADSRVIGLVPRAELVGKAKRVVISFDKNNYYLPRSGRFLERL